MNQPWSYSHDIYSYISLPELGSWTYLATRKFGQHRLYFESKEGKRAEWILRRKVHHRGRRRNKWFSGHYAKKTDFMEG